MFTIDDWKLFIPALATAIVGIGTILINNAISKRQIENANRLAEEQRKLTIATIVEKEWRTNLRLYTAGLIHSGTRYNRDLKAAATEEEKNKAVEHANEMHSNYTNLTVLIDLKDKNSLEYVKLLTLFLKQCGKTEVSEDIKLLEYSAKISHHLHKVTMPKGN